MIKNRKNPSGTYGTHLHPLVIATFETTGPIIEFGTGDFSTPILHEICKFQKRKLISYDDHKEWHQNFIDMKSELHEFQLVTNWNEVPVIKCGVVLIDHAPAERRVVDIERFQNHAEILVVHDTDVMHYYGYQPYFDKFKYTWKYERFSKSTTLLSNFIDVSKII